MVTTLALSTVMFFGVMLNAGESGTSLSPELAPPTSSLPVPQIQQNQDDTKAKDSKTRSALKEAQRRSTSRGQSHSSYGDESGYRQGGRGYGYASVMPTAPTDSSGGGGSQYQYLPPTSGGVAGSGSGYGAPSVDGSPTSARPGMASSYSSMQNAQQQNRRLTAARNATASAPVSSSKPFNAYQQQGSKTSAYMNLFRGGTAGGTIDNYNTLVRPELDQQKANQQFGADIHSLENSNRVQGLNILRLDRDTQYLQGVNATQYYMNYGDYYQNNH